MYQDYSKIYSAKEIEKWYKIYTPNISYNFNKLILSKLNRNERLNAHNTKLELPLTPHTNLSNTPFSFYANVNDKIIYAPISSIKFIDDLAIAYAWLDANGYSLETITDYISCLKLGISRFVGGKIPPPLEALHIPNNALDNDLVNSNSQKILKSIVVWVLSHELGHIVYQHPSYANSTFEQSQQYEKEADSFATDMFRRIGVPPAGMLLLFNVFTSFFKNRGDCTSDAEWQNYLKDSTHPFSNDRLTAIANELLSSPDKFGGAEPNKSKARQIVEMIGSESLKIAQIISDSEMQVYMTARALAIDANLLHPRKLGETAIMEQAYNEAYFDNSDFSGVYQGIFSRNIEKGGTEETASSAVFYRKDNKVSGRFSFGVGIGSLSGYIKSNQLTYNWKWGNATGKGVITMDDKGKFSGEWGYDDNEKGGGFWQGEKKDIQPLNTINVKPKPKTMKTNKITKQIEEAITKDKASKKFYKLVEPFLAKLGLNSSEQAVNEIVNFTYDYLRHVPQMTNALREASIQHQIGNYVLPIIDVIEDYFINPNDLIPDREGIFGILDDAYLSMYFIQSVNDGYKFQTGQALISLDFTQANQVARNLLGNQKASQLEHAVVQEMAKNTISDPMNQLVNYYNSTMYIKDPIWGNATVDEIVNTRLGAMGVV